MPLQIYVLKNILVVANVLAGCFGFMAVACGAYVLHNYHYVLNVVNDASDLYVTAVAFIIIGLLVMVITSLGCTAAVNDSPRALIVYSVILGLIVVAEVTIGWLSLARINVIQAMLDRSLRHLWDNKEHHVALWNTLQFVWSCCGLNSKHDWEHTPFSCCNPIRSLYFFCFAKINAHETPCRQAMHVFVSKYGQLFGLMAFGLGAIQTLGIVFAGWLAASLLRVKTVYVER